MEGANIHSLKNVLTLSTDVHGLFDALRLWFEPTVRNTTYGRSQCTHIYQDVQNHYKVVCAAPHMAQPLGIPPLVQFESSRSSSDLQLPSAEYLSIHAACCRVAHISGASKYLDDLDTERDKPGFVPADPDVFVSALAARLYSVTSAPVNMQHCSEADGTNQGA